MVKNRIVKVVLILVSTLTSNYLVAYSQTAKPSLDFKPGEVIFQVSNSSVISVSKSAQYSKTLGVTSIDDVFGSYEVHSLQKAFNRAQDRPEQSTSLNKSSVGEEVELANLGRTYVVKLDSSSHSRLFELVSELNELDDIIYAEPNYIFGTQFSFNPTVQIETATNLAIEERYAPNDPLFNEQYGIGIHNIDKVWQTTKGDGSSVIAILDTGVDYTHPDLAANMWRNPNESSVSNQNDSDGNGFVDDLMGWDFVNNDNNPMDDNIHGTHVAGIAAAVCDNELGIAGVNCNAKIMPIKVLQSSGRGDALTISQGVLYAVENGATVINMSFGGYSESITLKNALAEAYGSAFLVAAAGNDSRCIGPGIICAPMFPASYSFVMGVQDNNAGEIGNFSNYDQDGPVFSRYPDLWNYEVRAAGTSIMSTAPRGQYRTLTGTSMATPLVAGAVSLYKELRPDDNPELIFGNFINSNPNAPLDLDAALNVVPEPRLEIVTYQIDDVDGDGDGRPDAGETVELTFEIRNTWGTVNNVYVRLELSEFEDPTTIEFIRSEVPVGSISSYAIAPTLEPITIKLNNNLIDGRDISFIARLLVKENGSDVILKSMDLVLTAENMFEFQGPITEDMTWSGSVLLTNNVLVSEGARLTIEPGTTIYAYPNVFVRVDGTLLSRGTKENPIVWRARRLQSEYWKGLEFSGKAVGSVFQSETYDYISGSIVEYNEFYQLRNVVVSANQVDNGPLFKFNRFKDMSVQAQVDYTVWQPIKFESGSYYGNLFTNLENNWIGTAGVMIIKDANFTMNKLESSGLPRPTSLSEGVFGPNAIINIENTLFLNNHLVNNYFSQDWCPGCNLGALSVTGNSTVNNNVILPSELKSLSLTSIIFIGNVESFVGNSILNLYADYQIAASSQQDFNLGSNYFFGRGTREEIGIFDFNNDFSFSGLGRITLGENLVEPSAESYPFVVGVKLNGSEMYQSLTPSGDPLGVGTHTFEIRYNRPMDTSIDPIVTMGVREPYNQTPINIDGSWSNDGKTYTAGLRVGVNTGDGNNRLRIAGAVDQEGFETAEEYTRFNLRVDAAGALSGDFLATPGLGKVTLEWAEPSEEDVQDFLGFNIYRTQLEEDQSVDDITAESMTLISISLVTETQFTDFNVTPGESYYYGYTIVRTSLEESAISKIVTSTPLTAEKGDANGDFVINILDVMAIISHITGGNPEPFIFEAADVNSDNYVNVLDVVRTINIILNPNNSMSSSGSNPIANLIQDDNSFAIDSSTDVAAVQLEFKHPKEIDVEFELLAPFNSMEVVSTHTDSTLKLLVYNFNGKSVPAGYNDFVKFNTDKISAQHVVASTIDGNEIGVEIFNKSEMTEEIPSEYLLYQNYPNPFNASTTIRYALPEPGDVELGIYDVIGRSVLSYNQSNQNPGIHMLKLDFDHLATGVYIYRIIIRNEKGIVSMQSRKMMLLK